ncbi:hypothetical protein MASR2M78_36300 [Treponema sp.]
MLPAITPSGEGGAENAVAVSVRHTFSSSSPLALAIALGYGFASEGGPSPLGSMGGAELSVPLELELSQHLTLLASPGLIWTGKNSYASEAFPRPLFSGGMAYRANSVVAALSARSSLRFSSGANPEWSPVFIGAELHLVPPPSVFSINLSGGTWIDGSKQGYFGGFGLALIF